MTEDEYMALARQKYDDLQQLKTQPTFYDYEKSFDAIWQDLGRQVLEKTLSDLPTDRRKKKKMMTRYGQIQIANSELFSRHLNGFGISPYLQEKLVFLGQLEVYDQAAQVAKTLMGLPVAASQIYRLTNHYGAAIETDLDQPVVTDQPPAGIVYVQADGAMLLTDEGYKENKLSRIFKATALKKSPVIDRGGHIESCLFTAHLGNATDFTTKFRPHLDPYKPLGSDLVFISDGALWLRQLMTTHYPQATLILDFWHLMSYVGKVGVAAFRTPTSRAKWIDHQRNLLLDSKLDDVLDHIKAVRIPAALRDSVSAYLETNRDRMDYASYQKRGLLIGSGAIESAHRTVVQKRLKRSGQRWSLAGAQHVLNLRTCFMSQRWELVRKHIEPFN